MKLDSQYIGLIRNGLMPTYAVAAINELAVIGN